MTSTVEVFTVRKSIIRHAIAGALVLALTTPSAVVGQELFIYPDRGQSPEQQSMDKFQCYQWAVQQTGFNPTQPQTPYAAAPMAPPPSPGMPPPGMFGGAARGAALGAVGGAIGGNAGEGAAIGAGVGGLFGMMRRAEYERREQYQMQQYQQQYQTAEAQQYAAQNSGRANYNRAYRTCLSARGYTVG